MSIATLPELGSETFGEKLRRARERSGLRLLDATARIGLVFPISAPTLHRLETLTEPPTDWRRSVGAYLAVVTYGFNPVSFGLPENPFPMPVDIDAVTDLVRSGGVDLLRCTYSQHRWSEALSALRSYLGNRGSGPFVNIGTPFVSDDVVGSAA